MTPLRLRLFHGDVDLISDRSARRVLKNLGKAVRIAQTEVLRRFIFGLDLEARQSQSLADRTISLAQVQPTYYLDKLERGSLVLLGLASASLVGVLVKDIMDAVLDDDRDRRYFLDELKAYLADGWARDVAELTLADLNERGLGNHMVVSEASILADDDGIELSVVLDTELDEDGKVREHGEATTGSVAAMIDDKLEALDGDETPPMLLE